MDLDLWVKGEPSPIDLTEYISKNWQCDPWSWIPETVDYDRMEEAVIAAAKDHEFHRGLLDEEGLEELISRIVSDPNQTGIFVVDEMPTMEAIVKFVRNDCAGPWSGSDSIARELAKLIEESFESGALVSAYQLQSVAMSMVAELREWESWEDSADPFMVAELREAMAYHNEELA